MLKNKEKASRDTAKSEFERIITQQTTFEDQIIRISDDGCCGAMCGQISGAIQSSEIYIKESHHTLH